MFYFTLPGLFYIPIFSPSLCTIKPETEFSRIALLLFFFLVFVGALLSYVIVGFTVTYLHDPCFIASDPLGELSANYIPEAKSGLPAVHVQLTCFAQSVIYCPNNGGMKTSISKFAMTKESVALTPWLKNITIRVEFHNI